MSLDALFAADDARDPLEVLYGLGMEEGNSARSDYSHLHAASGNAFRLAPADVPAFQRAVRAAAREGLVIRPRGQGHSMNGHSIAYVGELELRSEGLSDMCRTAPDRILVGAGSVIAHVDSHLEQYGLELLVYNGGGPAPSVGGFISAGGYGTGSWDHGGFWNTVEAVHVVDAQGQLHVLRPGDDVFPYLFGSSGQLGYIVSAELRIQERQRDDGCVEGCDSQVGTRLDVGECAPVPWFPTGDAPIQFFWWHFMLESEEAEEAANELKEIRERQQDSGLTWLADINDRIPHKGLHAPLITKHATDVHATGIWVELQSAEEVPPLRGAIRAIEDEVEALARQKDYRRYRQVELTTGPEAWRSNLGEETYATFQAFKECWDPEHVFGRGVVFPAP